MAGRRYHLGRPAQGSRADGRPDPVGGGVPRPARLAARDGAGAKIDLTKLPITALIQSFVDALDAALSRRDEPRPVLSCWGDWLVMAVTLTHLRSRLLLPAEAPEAKAALGEAEALRCQLVLRAEMQAAADWLEQRPQPGREVFARLRPEGRAVNRGADITDLLRACLKSSSSASAMKAGSFIGGRTKASTYDAAPSRRQYFLWLERVASQGVM